MLHKTREHAVWAHVFVGENKARNSQTESAADIIKVTWVILTVTLVKPFVTLTPGMHNRHTIAPEYLLFICLCISLGYLYSFCVG